MKDSWNWKSFVSFVRHAPRCTEKSIVKDSIWLVALSFMVYQTFVGYLIPNPFLYK